LLDPRELKKRDPTIIVKQRTKRGKTQNKSR